MRHLSYFLLLMVVASGSSSATAQAVAKKRAHPHKKPAKVEPLTEKLVADTPAPPQPAPPPPTPEQGPSSPPEVSYQAGQLVIVARNSTMGDVLNAVRQKTGASVEMPAASTERVVGKFGPGSPRDVMAQLLNGSHYDYVLLGSPADPGALKKVVLMARASGPQQPQPPQPQPQPYQNPAFQNPAYQQNPNLQQVPEVENDQSSEDTQPDTSQDLQQPEQEQPQDQAQPGQPVVKTPEQLLRELQQQQQQQQQQQEQNGQPGPPPQ